MHVFQTRRHEESGHGWWVLVYEFLFLPRLHHYFQKLTWDNRVFLDDYHKLHVTRPEIKPIWEEKFSFVGLDIKEGGPEVREWLRQNLTGKCHMYVKQDVMTDMMFSFDTRIEKAARFYFARPEDAVKFQMVFG